jgi:coenzyme F420 biosynthesis associated uncharacterized protein
MIDWGLAGKIGLMVAGDGEAETPPVPLPGDLIAMCELAEREVTAYTGMSPVGELPWPEAVTRAGWLEANLQSMGALLEPVAEKAAGGLGPARPVAGYLLGAEVGALAGWLGRRVLGQYDVWLLSADRPSRLLFVAPNLREAAERLEVELEPLVKWVAFHEVTHAVQFSSVPWLREHLGGLMTEMLGTLDVEVDWREALKLPTFDDVKALVGAATSGQLVRLMAGDDRAEVLDRMQATMALVEGHAEHVMDAAGAPTLGEDLPQLRAALEKRRSERPMLGAFLEQLLGFDLKLRQYEVGKAFCDAVVEQAGIEALQRAWRSPEDIPTLAELADPAAWVARTA